MNTQKIKANQQIQSPTVRVILPTGQKVLPRLEAIALARNQQLDLILINETTSPPICKIENLGRFLYRKEKNKKPQKAPKPKEIHLHPNISPHDLQTKIRQARALLEHLHPLTLRVKFRGRENAHKEIGEEVLNQFLKETEDLSHHNGGPIKAGNTLILKLHPLKLQIQKKTHNEPNTHETHP